MSGDSVEVGGNGQECLSKQVGLDKSACSSRCYWPIVSAVWDWPNVFLERDGIAQEYLYNQVKIGQECL